MKHDITNFMSIYTRLYTLYGPQGWWPLLKYNGSQPHKTGSHEGYHPRNYELPETQNQMYEIILGSILTQNTTWTSAEKALNNLNKLDVIEPEKIMAIDNETLKASIRCAGFLNQKTEY